MKYIPKVYGVHGATATGKRHCVVCGKEISKGSLSLDLTSQYHGKTKTGHHCINCAKMEDQNV